MRYVVETVLNADIDNLQKIFPLKDVRLIEDDVFSFEHSSQNTYLINDLSENPAISRVYTEESYQKLNKYASLSTASLTFKLLWYGQCGKFDSENGDTLSLLPHKDKLIEVWKKVLILKTLYPELKNAFNIQTTIFHNKRGEFVFCKTR